MVNILSVAGRLPPWSPGALNLFRSRLRHLSAPPLVGTSACRHLGGQQRTIAGVTHPSADIHPDDQSGDLRCSAKGCRRPASYALRWNNPKLHSPERRKTWLACDDHRESLSEFLDLRGFLRDVTPL
jgi:hypothetical protein